MRAPTFNTDQALCCKQIYKRLMQPSFDMQNRDEQKENASEFTGRSDEQAEVLWMVKLSAIKRIIYDRQTHNRKMLGSRGEGWREYMRPWDHVLNDNWGNTLLGFGLKWKLWWEYRCNVADRSLWVNGSRLRSCRVICLKDHFGGHHLGCCQSAVGMSL